MRLNTIIALASLIAVSLTAALPSRAAEAVRLRDGIDAHPLGFHLSIMEDPGGKLTIDDAASDTMKGRFVRSKAPSPSYGFSDSAFWLSFTVRSSTSKNDRWLLELNYPLMDKISLYVPKEGGGFLEKHYGSLLPFSGRDMAHRNFIMELRVPPGWERTYYLRFENKDRIEFPMTLWSPDAFNRNMYLEQFIIGLYYGILLIMFLYNLSLYFSVKDISYLYYIIYIAAMGLFQLGQNGYLYQVLSGITDPPPVHFIPVTQALLIMTIAQFTQSFLNTKKYTGILHAAMNTLKALSAAYLTAPLFLDYTTCIKAGIALTGFLIPMVLLSGIRVVMQGYRPAYYFMAAWSVMIVAGTLFLLRVIAAIPHNTLTNYILHMGTSIELVLLSLGLGDRYNLMKEEQERISSELQVARRIQESLIPSEIPSIHGITTHTEYIPMAEVGGDLFDYHVVDEKRFGVLVADVSGHGIPAAIVSSMVKISFSQQVHNALDPPKLIEAMSSILRKEITGTFITAAYTLIDLEKRELTMSKCGHLPLYLFRNSEEKVLLLNPKGILISSLPVSEIGFARVPLDVNDKIVILTDGIIECRNREREMFGFDNFIDFIAKNKHLAAPDFCKLLIDTLRRWIHPAKTFDDDITLVVIDIV